MKEIKNIAIGENSARFLTVGSCNIVIGKNSGLNLKDESYQFIFTVPCLNGEDVTEFQTTMTPEEFDVVNKVVRRALNICNNEPLPPLNNNERKKTCLNVNCPERTGGECTAGEMNTNREEELRDIDERLPLLICNAVLEVTDGGVQLEPKQFLTYQDEPVGEYENLKSYILSLLQSERKRIGELCEKEKKEIGYSENEKPTLDDEVIALAFESNAEAWFNGFDNGINKAIEIIKNSR